MRLRRDFYIRDVLDIAPGLPGKYLTINKPGSPVKQWMITEVEAYRGSEDLACHASKGRTPRTEVMYHTGGKLYIYLIYGIYWMLNIVTGEADNPQAILIRGITGFDGPGKLTSGLNIDRSFYGIDLVTSDLIWIETRENEVTRVKKGTRIGIDYAGDLWKNKQWRFFVSKSE